MESHLSQLTPVIGGEWDMFFLQIFTRPNIYNTALLSKVCHEDIFISYASSSTLHPRRWVSKYVSIDIYIVHRLEYCLSTEGSIICPPIWKLFVHQLGFHLSTNSDIANWDIICPPIGILERRSMVTLVGQSPLTSAAALNYWEGDFPDCKCHQSLPGGHFKKIRKLEV